MDESSRPKIMVTGQPLSLVSIIRTNCPTYSRIDVDDLIHSDELDERRKTSKKPLITFIPCAVVMSQYNGVPWRRTSENRREG